MLRIDTHFDHVPQDRIDVIFNASQFDLSILDHGVCTAPVSVARLTDTSGIQDLNAVDFDQKLQMRMAHADNVRLDAASEFPRPKSDSGGGTRPSDHEEWHARGSNFAHRG